MSLTPPDLGKPYASGSERAAGREALLEYWRGIEQLEELAELPVEQWSARQLALFSRSAASKEHPKRRLERWVDFYRDELDLVQRVRNRVVHGGVVTDPELRGAAFLAERALSTALGVGEVDSARVHELITRSA